EISQRVLIVRRQVHECLAVWVWHFRIDEATQRLQSERIERERIGIIFLRPDRVVPPERGRGPEEQKDVLDGQEVPHFLLADGEDVGTPVLDQGAALDIVGVQRVSGVEILNQQAVLGGGGERQEHHQV